MKKVWENIVIAFMILFFINGSAGFVLESMETLETVSWFWWMLHGLNMVFFGTVLFNMLRNN